MLDVTSHSTAQPDGNSSESDPVDIVTDVVKIRIQSNDSASRVIRLVGFEDIRGCTAELLTSQIFKEEDAWVVRLTFRFTLIFIDRDGNERSLVRLIFFKKRTPFPIGCFDCRKFTPRVEVSNVSCKILPLLAALELVVDFHLIIKGLLREEITVLTPELGA